MKAGLRVLTLATVTLIGFATWSSIRAQQWVPAGAGAAWWQGPSLRRDVLPPSLGPPGPDSEPLLRSPLSPQRAERLSPTTAAPSRYRPFASISQRTERLPPVAPPANSPANAPPEPTALGPTALGPATLEPATLGPATQMQPPTVDGDESPVLSRSPSLGVSAESFVPWWQNLTVKPIRQNVKSFPADLNAIVLEALMYSPRIRLAGDSVLVAETSIIEAAAEFDATTFAETKIVRTDVPTGSTLDAGFNVSRLREEDWFFDAGVQRRNEVGGEIKVAQRIGLRDSNSQFFTPLNQGNSRLTISYNQPLLNGYGVAYNRSLIVLAELDLQQTTHNSSLELQEHLFQVVEAYWDLYFERVSCIQKQRHLSRAEQIYRRLAGRRELDAVESQIIRARAAAATRRAEVATCEASVRNAETQLRALVGSPQWRIGAMEIVPSQSPAKQRFQVSLDDAMVTAMSHRPELQQTSQEIEAARVRLNMAKHEMLPMLDVVLETYVSGLRGNRDIGSAFVNQFDSGAPSYTAGLRFELPFYRRAASARLSRRQIQLRQVQSKLQATMDLLQAEVEIAVRDVETVYTRMEAHIEAMLAAAVDAERMQKRWELLPGDEQAASFYLQDLLDAQDRLAAEENAFARAEIDYALSLTRLNKALGTLLQHQAIRPVRSTVEGQPAIRFEAGVRPERRTR